MTSTMSTQTTSLPHPISNHPGEPPHVKLVVKLVGLFESLYAAYDTLERTMEGAEEVYCTFVAGMLDCKKRMNDKGITGVQLDAFQERMSPRRKQVRSTMIPGHPQPWIDLVGLQSRVLILYHTISELFDVLEALGITQDENK